MQIRCIKCQKILVIPDDKLPKDKDKLTIKCPACGQGLSFSIPKQVSTHPGVTGVQQKSSQISGEQAINSPKEASNPGGDKTIIEWDTPVKFSPRLLNQLDGSNYELSEGDNIIGRSSGENTSTSRVIRINDPYISHRHCLLKIVNTHGMPLCTLSDDGSISPSGKPSTNGTFHNGKKVGPYDKIILNDGDIITAGHTELKFECN